MTKLPDNAIGRSAVSQLRTYGVDTSCIAYGGDRMGTYYIESGSVNRPSNVVYDRKGSAISQALPEDFDFDKAFDGADWFHISGLTPALGERGEAVTLAAIKKAQENNLTVSLDMNYRKKLWKNERQAMSVMTKLMPYVDVCIGSRGDAKKNLGMNLCKTNDDDTPNLYAYEQLSKDMMEKYKFKMVITTLRQSYDASHNSLAACMYDGDKFYTSTRYDMPQMVDRVGGGDAFAAGMIAGILDGQTNEDALEYAVAASVLKHTIPGDFNLSSKEEIINLQKGSRRISR
jgi:2-dehydro-3-deoxygluconokinase